MGETNKLIKGLLILERYRDDKNGCNTCAEDGVIYSYPTDRPLSKKDIKTMIKLGFNQENVEIDDDDEEFSVKHYDQDESWDFYT